MSRIVYENNKYIDAILTLEQPEYQIGAITIDVDTVGKKRND